MSNYRVQPVAALHDFVTGALIGLYGADGKEYFPLLSGAFGAPGNVTAANGINFFSTFTCSPANQNVTISPTGTGTVTINPATLGNIDNTRIGFTLRNTGGFTYLAVSGTDSSGTPGNVTNSAGKGRVAIAAGASSVVVTNTACVATATVFAVINQASADATLTQIVRVSCAAGSFTIFGNAAATANTVVDYFLLLN